MRFLATLVLAILIFAAGAAVFYFLHIALTGDEPNYRVKGGAVLLIVPWLLASWIVRRSPHWARESAVAATRVGLRASNTINETKLSMKSIVEDAKARESSRHNPRTPVDEELPPLNLDAIDKYSRR